MVDALLLQKKISQLSEYYSDLVEMQVISLADFVTDKKSRRYVERTLHLAVEVALDIGNHIIADNGWREPVDNKDVFTVLKENGLIPLPLQEKLGKMAQFRNLIVHDYAKIDAEIIYVIMQGSIDDLRAYMIILQQNYL